MCLHIGYQTHQHFVFAFKVTVKAFCFYSIFHNFFVFFFVLSDTLHYEGKTERTKKKIYFKRFEIRLFLLGFHVKRILSLAENSVF